MAKEQPDYSQFPLVGDTPESLAALVEQVIAGQPIRNVRLRSLDARREYPYDFGRTRFLARKYNASDLDWNP